ncbi:MAG: hypothetical protein WDZ75_00915 [Candidatus Paceibacterota bacterium]
MTQADTQYNPKFPHAHALLLDVYGNAIKSTGEESVVWCERFLALAKGWEALKGDGLLPLLFTQNFWEDVRDVMRRIHDDLNLNELTEQQKYMTFGVANLRTSFGGP